MKEVKEQQENVQTSQNQPFKVENYSKDGDTISFQLTGGLLVPDGGNILIEGTTISDLTEGEITTVEVNTINGSVYKYQILTIGDTTLLDHWSISYTDQSPDTYSLRISSPAVENHTVDYNSPAAALDLLQFSQS